MVFEKFASLLSDICSHSPLVSGRPLSWTIIANPKAGGFTIRSRWKKHQTMLEESAERAKKNPPRQGEASGKLHFTQASGHAREITDALINDSAAGTGERPFQLIITSGGDGTRLEVLNGLYHAPAELRKNFAVLRLPMGTGNDGADAWELDKALDLLIADSSIAHQRAIRLSTASGKGPFFAFNILSVGLDAFVTHMTNKMKGKMPGDSYKLWVDIGALFYDRIYKVDFMDVCARDEEGREVKAFREKLLLLAVGESGRRTYGSHKWILPDDRNICAIKQMPLHRKLLLKELLKNGGHAGKSESILWNSHSVEFSARHPILAQMDGETVLLEEGDFPARIELTEPVIPILAN